MSASLTALIVLTFAGTNFRGFRGFFAKFAKLNTEIFSQAAFAKINSREKNLEKLEFNTNFLFLSFEDKENNVNKQITNLLCN